MAKLKWDEVGTKTYETGVEKTALFVGSTDPEDPYLPGVAWSGMSNINEQPGGAESNKVYADDAVYLTLISPETFDCTIEAFMYPDEFAKCNGEEEPIKGVRMGQQTRKMFGLAYESILGNDLEGDDYGRILNIVYGLKASPSEKSRSTTNESTEASTMSWSASSTPVNWTDHKPVSKIEIRQTVVGAERFKAIEDVIYGTANADSRLPLPDELIMIIEAVDNGSSTATDPDPNAAG